MALNIEALLDAIKMITNKQISSLSFDITYICTIVDISKAANGHYRVKHQGTVFDAYSERKDYKLNDTVRVLNVAGDNTTIKYISGKHIVNDTETLVEYISPKMQLVTLTHNLEDNKEKELGQIAPNAKGYNVDKSTRTEELIYTLGEAECKKQFDNFGDIINSLYIKAKFQTSLSNLKVTKGNYGLRLELTSENKVTSIDWDSSEFFGDPYSFAVWTLQEKVVKIKEITGLKIFLYQLGNFTNEKGELSYQENIYPISVKDIEVNFCTNVEKVEDNTFKIVNQSGNIIYNNPEDINPLQKDVSILWFNKDENNNYIGFSDGIYDSSYSEDAYNQSQEDYLAKLKYTSSDYAPNYEESLQLYVSKDQINTYKNEIIKTQTKIENSIGQIKNIATDIQQLEEFEDNLVDVISNIIDKVIPNIDGYYQDCINFSASRFQDKPDSSLELKAPGSIDEEVINDLITDYLSADSDLAITSKLYANIVNKFKVTVSDYIGRIKAYANEINTLYNKDQEVLTKVKDLTQSLTIFDTTAKDFENRYSLYWFKADSQSEIMDYAGLGWKRIELDNKGLPAANNDGEMLPANSDEIVSIDLNADISTEKIKAILFYNHDKFESNILEFTNYKSFDEIPHELEVVHKDNSYANYQFYGQDNYLINATEQHTKRKIQLSHKQIVVDDAWLKDADIYWYIPTTNSMIYYDAKDNTILKSVDENMKLKGYQGYCYINIPKSVEEEDETPLELIYHISNRYAASAKNNTIICKVFKDEVWYTANITFSFGSSSSQGTHYSIAVLPTSLQTAVAPNYPLALNVKMYDQTNQEISSPQLDHPQIIGLNQDYELIDGTIIKLTDNATEIPYGILAINSVEQWQEGYVKLETRYPIAYTAEPTYYLQGSTTIVYNSFGSNPIYYKDVFKLYNYISNEEITDVLWEIHSNDNTITNYLPKISAENTLVPIAMFVKLPNDLQISLVARQKDSNEVLWAQPIIIMQNAYESATLNEWDGKFAIDENSGTILGTMIGVGEKDLTNAFSGLIMGKATTDSSEEQFGLYGYHNGVQSFGFKEDGTAFLGTSGAGRIVFNGNQGVIESGNFIASEGTEGMHIDLQSGKITAYNFKLESSGIQLNANPQENENYLYIGNDDNYLQYTQAGNFILKLNNFVLKNDKNQEIIKVDGSNSKIAGWTIDNNSLRIGNLGSPNSMWLCSTGTTTSASIAGSAELNDWVIACSDFFGVSKLGILFTQGAKINKAEIKEGTIDAAAITNGTIEAAVITKGSLGEATITSCNINNCFVNEILTVNKAIQIYNNVESLNSDNNIVLIDDTASQITGSLSFMTKSITNTDVIISALYPIGDSGSSDYYATYWNSYNHRIHVKTNSFNFCYNSDLSVKSAIEINTSNNQLILINNIEPLISNFRTQETENESTKNFDISFLPIAYKTSQKIVWRTIAEIDSNPNNLNIYIPTLKLN